MPRILRVDSHRDVFRKYHFASHLNAPFSGAQILAPINSTFQKSSFDMVKKEVTSLCQMENLQNEILY